MENSIWSFIEAHIQVRAEVYKDSMVQYEKVKTLCNGIINSAMKVIEKYSDGDLFSTGVLEPSSITSLSFVAGQRNSTVNTGLLIEDNVLENNYIRFELNTVGEIVRIYDKENLREVLSEGSIANQLQAFEDRPLEWDAWDIESYYDDKMWTSELRSVKVLERGVR